MGGHSVCCSDGHLLAARAGGLVLSFLCFFRLWLELRFVLHTIFVLWTRCAPAPLALSCAHARSVVGPCPWVTAGVVWACARGVVCGPPHFGAGGYAQFLSAAPTPLHARSAPAPPRLTGTRHCVLHAHEQNTHARAAGGRVVTSHRVSPNAPPRHPSFLPAPPNAPKPPKPP